MLLFLANPDIYIQSVKDEPDWQLYLFEELVGDVLFKESIETSNTAFERKMPG